MPKRPQRNNTGSHSLDELCRLGQEWDAAPAEAPSRKSVDEIIANWEHNIRLQDGKTTVLSVWASDAAILIAEIAALREALTEAAPDRDPTNPFAPMERPGWTDPAEAMRAKCEKIAQAEEDADNLFAAARIRNAIAALKNRAAPAKPTVVIGQPTMDRLKAGEAVELDAVIMIPASDLHSSP